MRIDPELFSDLGIEKTGHKRLIEKWLRETHRISVEVEPHEIIGQLVNSEFAGGRLQAEPIIKASHYSQGPIAVFRKVCDYLMSCERMPKNHVLQMASQVEEGNVD